MSKRRDPSGFGSQPEPLEHATEHIDKRPQETTGLGQLVVDGEPMAEVRYTATLIEEGGPKSQPAGPIFTGHGILTSTRDADIEPGDTAYILHLENGHSVPVIIEAQVGDRDYRFRVQRA